ncbi:MAG: hypothetical protein AAGJ79_12200 [Verrucomicrobiota bacterium]
MKTTVVAMLVGIIGFFLGALAGPFSISGNSDLPNKRKSSADLRDNPTAAKGVIRGNSSEVRSKSSHRNFLSTGAYTVPIEDLLEATTPHSLAKTYETLSPRLDSLDDEELAQLIEDLETRKSDPRSAQALSVVALKFSENSPRAALEFFFKTGNPHSPYAWTILNNAPIALLESSPEDAIEFTLRIPSSRRSYALSKLLEAAARDRPELIPSWISRPEVANAFKNPESSWAIRDFVKSWSRTELTAATEFALFATSGQSRESAIQSIASQQALEDGPAAIAWARELKNPALRKQALTAAIKSITSLDPQSALSLLDEADNAGERRGMLASLGSAWAAKDKDGFHSWVQSLEDPRDVQAALAECAHIVTDDPVKFLQLTDNLPRSQKKNIYEQFVRRWAQKDPKATNDWVNSIEDPLLRNDARKQVISTLSYQNPELAVEFIKGMDDSSEILEDYAPYLGRHWAGSSPQDALAWAEGLENHSLRTRTLRDILSAVASNDPETAIAYIDGNLTKPSERTEAISNVLGSWVLQDDEAALAWSRQLAPEDRLNTSKGLLTNLVNHGLMDAAILEYAAMAEEIPGALGNKSFLSTTSNIVGRIAEDDPASAISIFEQIPDTRTQINAAANITRFWLNADPIAASEWVGSLPEGEVRDSGAKRIIDKIVGEDGEGAFHWALSISSNSSMMSYAKKSISSLAQDDPQTAISLISNSGLSEEQQIELLKTIQ